MSDTSRMDMVTVDLSKPLQRENCGALLATGDENANRFGAHIVRGGASVDLTGCTVSGSFIRADGVTVPLEGAAEGNTAHVDLTAQCYAVDGVFSLALKISGEGYAHTIRMVDGYIRRTDTGKYVDSDDTVYSAEELMAVLKEMDGMENPGSADTMLEGTEMIGADGTKVTGTIEILDAGTIKPELSIGSGMVSASVRLPHGKYINNPNNIAIVAGNTIPSTSITITPKAETQIFESTDGMLYKKVTVQGDSDLIPDNIKSGVSIFGVEGSYGGSGADDSLWTNNGAQSIGNAAYYNCELLVNVKFTLATSINQNAFSNCYNLVKADFTKNGLVGYRAFRNCRSLKTLILRGSSLSANTDADVFEGCCHIHGTVDETYNPEGLQDGYIYVQDDLVEGYQALWTDCATQIRPLSEYTEG